MKKILIIDDNSTSQIGGVITTQQKIVNILREKGHEVKIINHDLFYSFPLAPWFPEVYISLFPRRKLKKAIIKEKPDHIHIVTEGLLGYIARKICTKNKIKFTTSYHTNFDFYLQERIHKSFFKITKSYLYWFHSKAENVMASTQSLKEDLEKKGYKNVVICPLGVDVNFFKKPEKIVSSYKKPIFTYLGRLAKEKNVKEFFECNLPGTKLVIGDGPERKNLERVYSDKAIFVGIKTGQELVNLLSQSDVLVFPSKTDTFGLTIVEALACEVPVAAHNVMGPKDIITHNVDGFLDDNLEKAALKCLNLNKEVCRTKALKFSWENSAEAFLENLR